MSSTRLQPAALSSYVSTSALWFYREQRNRDFRLEKRNTRFARCWRGILDSLIHERRRGGIERIDEQQCLNRLDCALGSAELLSNLDASANLVEHVLNREARAELSNLNLPVGSIRLIGSAWQ